MTSQTGRRCRCRGCSLPHPTRHDGTAVTATIWAVFLASLTVTAYGVAHSDVLANLWPRTLAEQVAMLAVGAALTAGICMQRRGPMRHACCMPAIHMAPSCVVGQSTRIGTIPQP